MDFYLILTVGMGWAIMLYYGIKLKEIMIIIIIIIIIIKINIYLPVYNAHFFYDI